MKGKIMLRILENMEITTRNTGSLFDVFLADRATSYKKLRGLRISHKTPLTSVLREYLKEKQRFSSFFYYLKKDGLILEAPQGKHFLLTKKGKKKLEILRESRRLSFPDRIYQKEDASHVVIVSFDIPEKEKRKRVWLRAALRQLGFSLVQRSVWIGKVKLPKEFVDDLRSLKLLSCVEIFSVTREGSLKRI